MPIRTQVFGPAYLDRVLLVDQPLVDPARSSPLDQSVGGLRKFGDGLTFRDPDGSRIVVTDLGDWPGPFGEMELSRRLGEASSGWTQTVRALGWHDDLGGMGAGYAAAFGGELVCALGSVDDPTSVRIAQLLKSAGVIHRAIRVENHEADWTLLLTSGPFGDKLPVGFRGCHATLTSLGNTIEPARLRVAAALPNRLCEEALKVPGANIRFFAPTSRNMTDCDVPVTRFAQYVDILSCNRREWESLEGREQVAWQVSILAITDGPNGSQIRFTTSEGEPGRITVPAFPRVKPPVDTNRAGEAYAWALVSTLIDAGWTPGICERSLIEHAARRAAVAAALVLDRKEFGFPSWEDVKRATRIGEGALAVRGPDDTIQDQERLSEPSGGTP